jgi:hypothetical protein
LFLKLAISKIKLAKELFVLDLEQGNEVFIVKDISQAHLPLTLCFYDSLLQYCHENVSEDTRRFYKFKNVYRMNFFKNENLKHKFLEKAGVVEQMDDSYNTKKQTFKHSVVNRKELKNINHHLSAHAKSLQRSTYLTIDDDLERVQDTFFIQQKFMKEQLNKFEIIKGGGLRVNKFNFPNALLKDNSKLLLRFCNPKEVNQKRKENHFFKTTFLAKMEQLKEKGKKLEKCRSLEIWLENQFRDQEKASQNNENIM